MKIEYIEKNIADIKADIELIVVVDKNLDHPMVKEYKDTLEAAGFSAGQDEVILLPESKKLFVGAESLKSKHIRPAVATAIRSLLGKKYKSLKVTTYLSHQKCTATARALAEALQLGAYDYNRYKSKAKDTLLKKIYISLEEYNAKDVDKAAIKRAVEKGLKTAKAVNLTRDIVNTPPDDFYPKIMARLAKDVAKSENLEYKVLTRREITAFGFLGL